MKSVFLTFLIFAGVFLLAGSGVLSVIGEKWFHYTSYVIFAVVLLTGIYATLIRNKPIEENDDADEPTKADTNSEQKESENGEK